MEKIIELTQDEKQELLQLGYNSMKLDVRSTTKRTLTINSCYYQVLFDEFENAFNHLDVMSDERYQKIDLAKQLLTKKQIGDWFIKLTTEPNFDFYDKLPSGYEIDIKKANNINCKTLTIKVVDADEKLVYESFKIKLTK